MLPPRSPMSERTPSTEQVPNSPPQPHDSLLPEQHVLFSLSIILPSSVCVFLSVKHTLPYSIMFSPRPRQTHLLSKSLGSPGCTWQCSQEPRSGWHTCMPVLEPLVEFPIFWQACKNSDGWRVQKIHPSQTCRFVQLMLLKKIML